MANIYPERKYQARKYPRSNAALVKLESADFLDIH